ncbi:MAG: biotin/lipoyl-containing protein [candidate division Zixibacteria bacterium]
MAEFELIIGDKTYLAELKQEAEATVIKVGGSEFSFEVISPGHYEVTNNGKKQSIAAVKYRGKFLIDIDAMLFEVSESGQEEFGADSSAHAGEKDKVYAPMPGKIVKLLVKVGDRVSEKQPLMIVEAMKMENQINSPASGIVKAVNSSVGDQVDTISAVIELDLEA